MARVLPAEVLPGTFACMRSSPLAGCRRRQRCIAGVQHISQQQRAWQRGSSLSTAALPLPSALLPACPPGLQIYFGEPVKESYVPNYYTVIKNPMDLGTIKSEPEGQPGGRSLSGGRCSWRGLSPDVVVLLC